MQTVCIGHPIQRKGAVIQIKHYCYRQDLTWWLLALILGLRTRTWSLEFKHLYMLKNIHLYIKSEVKLVVTSVMSHLRPDLLHKNLFISNTSVGRRTPMRRKTGLLCLVSDKICQLASTVCKMLDRNTISLTQGLGNRDAWRPEYSSEKYFSSSRLLNKDCLTKTASTKTASTKKSINRLIARY